MSCIMDGSGPLHGPQTGVNKGRTGRSHALERNFEKIAGERYNLAVIGGGIIGTGIARDAALRGSSIRMLALLDSGDIDYAFEYFSVTEQHNLRFLPLPPEIKLSVLEKADLYTQITCELDFHR
jgi:ABC-type molybdate transport system substrate-binding protein